MSQTATLRPGTKKPYQTPATHPVRLLHQAHLLTASSGPKMLQGRRKTGEETEDDWMDLE